MLRRPASLHGLAGLNLEVDLLVAHVGPELDALQGNLVHLRLHGVHGDGKQCLEYSKIIEKFLMLSLVGYSFLFQLLSYFVILFEQ